MRRDERSQRRSKRFTKVTEVVKEVDKGHRGGQWSQRSRFLKKNEGEKYIFCVMTTAFLLTVNSQEWVFNNHRMQVTTSERVFIVPPPSLEFSRRYLSNSHPL